LFKRLVFASVNDLLTFGFMFIAQYFALYHVCCCLAKILFSCGLLLILCVFCNTISAMNEMVFEFDAVIRSSEVGKGGAFVSFPYDVREVFQKGRVKVHATFDGVPYDGSIVNMGVKNADGSVCYIIGILKDIRAKIGKQAGDSVRVTVRERE